MEKVDKIAGMKATDWHPYADRPYRDELACVACGKVKPRGLSPIGWWRRYRPKERRTEARCPGCRPR